MFGRGRLLWIHLCCVGVGCGRIHYEELGRGREEDAALGGDGSREVSTPRVLGAFQGVSAITALASPYEDDDPALSPNLLELYFTSDRPNGVGMGDIWVSERASPQDQWPAPRVVTELSTPGDDKGPGLSHDSLSIWLHQSGGLQVWTRSSLTASWSFRVEVTELAGSGEDGTPQPYADSLAIAFRSQRASTNMPLTYDDFDLFKSTRAS